MTESEVLFQISDIVHRLSFPQAVDRIAHLLQREAGGKAVVVQDDNHAATLLDSFDHPYRSLYTVDLLAGGEALGKVTLCFASDKPQGDLPQRLSDFAGQQLGMLLARDRLAERAAELKREISERKQGLTSRKLLQRAEGILIAQRGMKSSAAKHWILQQSEKTGLSKQDVADRIIAYHQATGISEQKIA